LVEEILKIKGENVASPAPLCGHPYTWARNKGVLNPSLGQPTPSIGETRTQAFMVRNPSL